MYTALRRLGRLARFAESIIHKSTYSRQLGRLARFAAKIQVQELDLIYSTQTDSGRLTDLLPKYKYKNWI